MARAAAGRAKRYAAAVKRADGPTRPRYPLALIHPLGPAFRHLPLSLRRHLLYLRTYGRWGNFRAPKRGSEKTQWRIINDHRAILAFTQDKLAAKEYVRTVLVEHQLEDFVKIPATLWVGTDVRELQALSAQLPARWVLKPNHSSGRFRVLDSDEAPLNWSDLIAAGDQWVQRDEEELVFGHWAYGQARHLLIAEERVGGGEEPPLELKAHTHDGETIHYFWVDRARPSASYSCFRADGSWFRWRAEHDPINEDPGDLPMLATEARERFLELNRAIGSPFDKIRVDYLYEHGALWFGELTSYQTAGLFPVSDENDDAHGACWALPDLTAPDPREAEWRALLEGVPKGTLQR